jgi:hypothetical protein
MAVVGNWERPSPRPRDRRTFPTQRQLTKLLRQLSQCIFRSRKKLTERLYFWYSKESTFILSVNIAYANLCAASFASFWPMFPFFRNDKGNHHEN